MDRKLFIAFNEKQELLEVVPILRKTRDEAMSEENIVTKEEKEELIKKSLAGGAIFDAAWKLAR